MLQPVLKLSRREQISLREKLKIAVQQWLDVWCLEPSDIDISIDRFSGMQDFDHELRLYCGSGSQQKKVLLASAGDWTKLMFAQDLADVPKDETYEKIVLEAQNQILEKIGVLIKDELVADNQNDCVELVSRAAKGEQWFECRVKMNNWVLILLLNGYAVKALIGRGDIRPVSNLHSKSEAILEKTCRLEVSLNLGEYKLSSFEGLSVGDVLTSTTTLNKELEVRLGERIVAVGALCQESQQKAIRLMVSGNKV